MSTDTTVPITKERAGEILCAVAIETIRQEGLLSPKEVELMIEEAQDDLAEIGISKEEAAAFVLFINEEARKS